MAYLATHTLDEMNRPSGFAGLRAAFSRFLTAMQVARMESVLRAMPAQDRKRIGVKDADISAYARSLVVGD